MKYPCTDVEPYDDAIIQIMILRGIRDCVRRSWTHRRLDADAFQLLVDAYNRVCYEIEKASQ